MATAPTLPGSGSRREHVYWWVRYRDGAGGAFSGWVQVSPSIAVLAACSPDFTDGVCEVMLGTVEAVAVQTLRGCPAELWARPDAA